MFASMKVNHFIRLRLLSLLLVFVLCDLYIVDAADCSAGNNSVNPSGKADEIQKIIERLTPDEKICQLFILTPEALTGVETVTAAGERTEAAIWESPVGGLIYMSPNLEYQEQIAEMLRNTQQYSKERIGLPLLLAVDEEGGSVCRIGGRGIVEGVEIPSMRQVGESKDYSEAYRLGSQMGSYLSDLGFNVDFAPVADVLTNPENTVVRDRSFGSDPKNVSKMVVEVMRGLSANGVIPTLKHFPGHGSTGEDSHEGYAISYETMDELFENDLVPFMEGISNGARIIMAGHISLPDAVGSMVPASLNYTVLTELLRKQLGYDGLIITDALNMGAITEHYDSSEAAVKALQAGCDMLLMPSDWYSARQGVRSALEEGTLSEERIDESLYRIISLKQSISNL